VELMPFPVNFVAGFCWSKTTPLASIFGCRKAIV